MARKKEYDTEKYERIEYLVAEYQKGNQEAVHELIQMFHHFFNRYVRLIKEGIYNLKEKYIRKFIQLYMTPKEAKNIGRFYMDELLQKRVKFISSLLMDLFKEVSGEEIYQECVIAFLRLAKGYTRVCHLAYFNTYMLMYFHYRLRDQLKKMMNTNVLFKYNTYMRYNDNYSAEYTPIYTLIDEHQKELNKEVDIKKEDKRKMTKESDELSDNWVNGINVGDMFEELDVKERRILKLSYVDKISDIDIGEMFGVTRETINRKKMQIKRKIQEKMIEQKLLKI